MRKLVVATFLTVDGVMQSPGGPEEDRQGGFELGGWGVTAWDEEMGRRSLEQHLRPDALLLGRRTYEIFAAHWPRVGADHEHSAIAVKLNTMPKYVASRTLDRLEWNNSTLLDGDLPEAVAELKVEPGTEILCIGSGNLIQSLMQHDLVDEYILWTFPVIIGRGARLFADGAVPAGLRLVETKGFGTGVVVNTYGRAGAPEIGSFLLEE
ncbi:MAG: dihydrofolate reductase family protein [Acidimicrobiia bacterium]